ncbi:MAG: hypothetical protein HKN20_13020 [Gemmatimonadetes bacterium]|nr:hypothetical protein [Gemmatimonadota bacterium]
MLRTFLAILTLWALLASPGVCLAGLTEHVCTDAPADEVSCGHEEACAEDPCVDSPIRADNERNKVVKALAAPLEQSNAFEVSPWESASLDTSLPHEHRRSLPVHESDLPLLR